MTYIGQKLAAALESYRSQAVVRATPLLIVRYEDMGAEMERRRRQLVRELHPRTEHSRQPNRKSAARARRQERRFKGGR